MGTVGDRYRGQGPDGRSQDAIGFPAFDDPVDDNLIVRTPTAWLGAALLAQAGSVVLFLAPGTTKHVVGYLLAAVLSSVMVALFWHFDARARTNRGYVERPGGRRTASTLLVTGILIAAAHTWFFATTAAR